VIGGLGEAGLMASPIILEDPSKMVNGDAQ
jgi:hypothetical protein